VLAPQPDSSLWREDQLTQATARAIAASAADGRLRIGCFFQYVSERQHGTAT